MIVDREEEKQALRQLVARATAREGSTLVLVGEPGLGKTTLLEWAMGLPGTTLTLRAAGHESESDLPFVSLADLLRPIEAEMSSLAPPHFNALNSALAMSPAEFGDRLAVDAAVLRLLTHVASHQAVLVVIDDYQWLDSATRGVIEYMARRSGDAGVGLLIATRSVTPIDHGGKEIELAPLSEEAAIDLVSQIDGMKPEMARRVVALAAGNPLALVELPHALSHEEIHGESPLGPPLEVSAALHRAFSIHLDRLSEGARLAVLCLAEEGTGDLGVVYRTAESLGITANDIDEAIVSGVLIEDGATVRFRHPLVGSVAHATAPPSVLRRIHSVYASTVNDPDRRAWHLAGAAVGSDEAAATALEELARRALARGAAAAAANALRKAAQLGIVEERYRRLVAAARAAHRSGNLPRTTTLVQQARALGGPYVTDPALTLLEADLLMRKGSYAEAYGMLRLEAANFTVSDPHQAATMLMVAAKLRVFRFEGAAAVTEVDEALSLFPESEREVVHHAALAMTQTMAGHASARDTARLAAESALAAPHGHIHSLGIGWPLIWLEEYEMASAFLTRSARIQREGGYLAYLPLVLLPMAELEFRTGHWAEARRHINEAIHLLEESDQPTEASVALALMARIEAATGNIDEARSLAAAAGAKEMALGLRVSTLFSQAVLGFVELAVGNNAAAVSLLDQCHREMEHGGTLAPWILTSDADLAEALIRLGDRDHGLEIAASLLERGQDTGVRSAVAAARRSIGLAGSENDFRDSFEEALEIHQSLPTPFEMARTQLAYGERLRRSKSRMDARRLLRAALATFEALGAPTWAARARLELEVSGETLERPASVAALTRQERRVAALVAGGATNQEAAATLFVNKKTVEFHLANVYRKLGVRSRTELANALRSDGSLPTAVS